MPSPPRQPHSAWTRPTRRRTECVCVVGVAIRTEGTLCGGGVEGGKGENSTWGKGRTKVMLNEEFLLVLLRSFNRLRQARTTV
jgi:hypothetical protein